MNNFTYKDVYIEDGKRVLEINVLPEKYCNFDCIFCPIGRSKNKIDTQRSFDHVDEALIELENMINDTNPDLIFINSKGEALINDKIENIIDFIKSKGVPVRLLSNGYILGKDEYIKVANKCDEVIGEIKVITEEDFKKVQRPIEGYTLHEYISNMASFNKQYNGKFIFEITIVKGYNDDPESVNKLKEVIKTICPNEVIVARIDDDIFKKKLGISDERFEEIEVLSENEIVEKQIINNDLNITYSTGSLSKKKTLNIKADLEKTLNNLDNFEKNIAFEGFLLDSETRKAFKESLEHSMKMAKLIAKNKFSSKAN